MMTYVELLRKLISISVVEGKRLDEEVEVYVSGEYYSEVLPAKEFTECRESGRLQFTVDTGG